MVDEDFKATVRDFVVSPVDSPSAATIKMADLGRQLFSDRRFSENGQVACASCHMPTNAFSQPAPTSLGGLSPIERNAPTIVNSYLNHWFMWDGRADSLEAQALLPVEDPREHGISRQQVVQRLLQNYPEAYLDAFGTPPKALLNAQAAGQLEGEAAPEIRYVPISLDVGAYGLATLGDFADLRTILDEADRRRMAPALVLGDLAMSRRLNRPQSWIQTWEKHPQQLRTAINEVFFNFGRALAAYQRGLRATASPFDAFASSFKEDSVQAEDAFVDGFGAQEWRGLKLFAGHGGCIDCHSGPNFSDQQFHNIGLSRGTTNLDYGRITGQGLARLDQFNCLATEEVTNLERQESCLELPYLDDLNLELVGAFKTPSLRNVASTPPYMHDGRFDSLREVIRHYDELQDTPAIGHREETLQPLHLDPSEIDDLVAFLKALNSPISDVYKDFDPSKAAASH